MKIFAEKVLGTVGWLFAVCPLSEAMYNPSTQPAAEPRQPYGHALMGVRVLKFDGAIAPRVLKFDSGSAAEGCSMAPYIY